MAGTLCFLCCQNFGPAVAAAIAAEGWSDVTSAALPARCGKPPLSWDEVRAHLPPACSQLIILGRSCLTALEKAPPGIPPVSFERLENCFQLVAGNTLTADLIEQGAYLVTPGWLVHWRDHMTEMGFDPDHAGDFFQDFARELVLLDTGTVANMPELLTEVSKALGLPCRRITVGLDHVRLFLGKWRSDWHRSQDSATIEALTSKTARETADHQLAMDVLTRLAHSVTEADVVTAIEEFFRMLFAPEEFCYLPIKNGLPEPETSIAPAIVRQLLALQGGYAFTPSGLGFLLSIVHEGQVLGLVWVDQLAFPAYRERYLNLALAIVGICGLAIHSARNRKKLIEAEKMASLSVLVAGVTHGINTPLGVCLSTASTLQRDSRRLADRFAERAMTQSDLKTYLATAEATACLLDSNLSRIGHLIEAFRQVAVLGREERTSRLRLKAILDDVIRSLSVQLTGDRVVLRIACDENLQIESVADDWHSIFVNLISNSLRHGFKDRETGIIDITIAAGHGQLNVDYHDDGNGIAPDVQARMFDPFYTTDLQQGMGLGLHLVYNLVTHRLRGVIECDSQPGQGARFLIRIPLP